MFIHTEVVNLHYMRAGKRINRSEKLYCIWSRLHRALGGTKRTDPLVSVYMKILECCCIDSEGTGKPCCVNLRKHVWWLEFFTKKACKNSPNFSATFLCPSVRTQQQLNSLNRLSQIFDREESKPRSHASIFFLRTTKVHTNLESSIYQLL